MCAIFGLIDYKNALSARAKEKILKVLSRECEVRGTDATVKSAALMLRASLLITAIISLFTRDLCLPIR